MPEFKVICQPWFAPHRMGRPKLVGFSIHESEEAHREFTHVSNRPKGRSPEGNPYEIIPCEEHAAILRSQSSAYIHCDEKNPHPELRKPA